MTFDTLPMLLVVAGVVMLSAGARAADLPQVPGATAAEVLITSTLDGTQQPSVVVVPEACDPNTPTPLLIGMHTWSADYLQMVEAYGKLAVGHKWLLVLPNFRGANKANNPNRLQAGGSVYMQHDIIDAYHYMLDSYKVDADRVYATGGSGGGHATLLIVSKYPDLFAAAAAWCPVTDFNEWWQVQNGYAKDVEAVTGGKPGDSPAMDFEYARRSPRTFITNLANVPVMLGHGDRDGTIPVEQSWETFRRLGPLPAHKMYFYGFSGGHTAKAEYGLDWCQSFVRSHQPPTELHLVTDESKPYYWAELVMADPERLATCDLKLAEDVLGVTCANLSGLKLDLSGLTLPDGGLTVSVRNDAPLQLTIQGLPAGAKLDPAVEWAQATGGEGALALTVQPSEEARSLRLAY